MQCNTARDLDSVIVVPSAATPEWFEEHRSHRHGVMRFVLGAPSVPFLDHVVLGMLSYPALLLRPHCSLPWRESVVRLQTKHCTTQEKGKSLTRSSEKEKSVSGISFSGGAGATGDTLRHSE